MEVRNISRALLTILVAWVSLGVTPCVLLLNTMGIDANIKKYSINSPAYPGLVARIRELKDLAKTHNKNHAFQKEIELNFEMLTLLKKYIDKLHGNSTAYNTELKLRRETLKARVARIIVLNKFRVNKGYTKNELKKKIKKLGREYITDDFYEIALLRADKAFQGINAIGKLKVSDLNDEGSKVEHKKSFSSRESISKALVAFSNSEGGRLYIGVAEIYDLTDKDDYDPLGKNYGIVGVFNNTDLHRQKLMKYVKENTTLDTALLRVTVYEHKNKKVVEILTPRLYKRFGSLSFFQDDAYLRIDNANRKISSREVYELTISERAIRAVERQAKKQTKGGVNSLLGFIRQSSDEYNSTSLNVACTVLTSVAQ